MLYTLVLQFYLKNEQKQKTRWYFSEQKNRRKTKQSYHNDIKVEIARGIVWINILKR